MAGIIRVDRKEKEVSFRCGQCLDCFVPVGYAVDGHYALHADCPSFTKTPLTAMKPAPHLHFKANQSRLIEGTVAKTLAGLRILCHLRQQGNQTCADTAPSTGLA